MKTLKSRKKRNNVKHLLKRLYPSSSVIRKIVSNYKHWLWKCSIRINSFSYYHYPRSSMKKNKITKKGDENQPNYSLSKQFVNLTELILLSGDVERNPGPFGQDVRNGASSEIASLQTLSSVFNDRLARHGLISLDVGGSGDCLFRSVAHQLYGDPGHHLDIRAAGVYYLIENPERFIEGNTAASWNEYLSNDIG